MTAYQLKMLAASLGSTGDSSADWTNVFRTILEALGSDSWRAAMPALTEDGGEQFKVLLAALTATALCRAANDGVVRQEMLDRWSNGLGSINRLLSGQEWTDLAPAMFPEVPPPAPGPLTAPAAPAA